MPTTTDTAFLDTMPANVAVQFFDRVAKSPDAEAFRAALNAFTRDADALRTDAIVRELPAQAFGQVFALSFAFEQFQKNLGDLLARTDELVAERTKATSGS